MRKRGVVIGLTIAAVSVIVVPVVWGLGQVEAGICPSTGVQMSNADLRARVLSGLIDIGLENIRVQDADHFRGGLGLRVAGPMSDREIAKALFDLKNGGNDFAGKFGAREVTQGASGHVESIREPFLLLNYSTYGGYTATRTASQDVISVNPSSLPAGTGWPGLVNRLRGFGIHYYRIQVRQFIYDCCTYKHGTRVHPAVPGSTTHYWETGKDGSVIIGNHDLGGVAYVSNCGEIMTRRNARGFTEVKWIKGE
ncbi:hypothetical protein JR064_22435 [Xanthomonas sp. CFBP 8703]|uniref:Uncharacterized protein n=1 Tax=Xanthomonas bonasiae TaxID=2810351 RepID=A0ABS3B9G8_9XANT|nr:hypothetical protein [Xanthomonas bonasiae]MBN6104912.1 hypothetical protein [Xanthomonas bonasiae]